MDVFPRCGTFVGFFPLHDPRLMWHNVLGAGGARELLWLEQREGYMQNFLESFALTPGDCMVIFSHGVINAASIEAAQYAKQKGLKIITVSSLATAAVSSATRSSSTHRSELADVALDNCLLRQDAPESVDNRNHSGAGPTIASAFIAMALMTETGARLKARGLQPELFPPPHGPDSRNEHDMSASDLHKERRFKRSSVKYLDV